MDLVIGKLLILLTTVLVNLRLSTSIYLTELCWQNGVTNTISCPTDEIIRIRKTILSAVPVAPGVPLTCENLDRFNFCRAPTNRSDVEFIARQRATYSVESEDLAINPEKGGDCPAGVRSNMAQVYYECVPTKGNYLQSICANQLWENEVSGYLNSPYFPNNYPDSEKWDLDCYCELRPEPGSRVELLGVLMHPSSSGRTWTLEADSGNGYTQDLSSQFYVSRRLTLLTSTSTVRLRFRSQGEGQQQPSRTPGPPPGFWLEYRAVKEGTPEFWIPSGLSTEGRVTLYCNEPYIREKTLAGSIAGGGALFIIIIIIIVCICCIRKRRRRKEASYSADRPVQSNRDRQVPQRDVHKNRAFEESEDYQPYNHNNYHPRNNIDDYPEKEPYGRNNHGRSSTNTSYSDKVFLDEVDRKSIPSSGRTGDNDSIAKKSLSGSSQEDNYSEVNYSPKGPRHYSLGRDTAV